MDQKEKKERNECTDDLFLILAFTIIDSPLFSGTFLKIIHRHECEVKLNAKMLCYDKAINTYAHTNVLQKTFALGTYHSYQSEKCRMSPANTVHTTNEWLMEHDEKSLLGDVCTSSTRAMQLAELPLILQVLKGPSSQ